MTSRLVKVVQQRFWDAAMRPSGLELQDWSSFLLSLEMKSLRRRLRLIKAKLGPSAQQRRRHRVKSASLFWRV